MEAHNNHTGDTPFISLNFGTSEFRVCDGVVNTKLALAIWLPPVISLFLLPLHN